MYLVSRSGFRTEEPSGDGLKCQKETASSWSAPQANGLTLSTLPVSSHW